MKTNSAFSELSAPKSSFSTVATGTQSVCEMVSLNQGGLAAGLTG
jgi:hypothetical protein